MGDVRGKGLMIGVELISDSKAQGPLESERMLEIFENIKNMGVLVGKGGLHANVSQPLFINIYNCSLFGYL